MKIVVDAMGGDFAPKVNVDGAIDARTTRGSSESTAGRMIAMFLRPKPSAVRRIVPRLPLSLGWWSTMCGLSSSNLPSAFL